MYDSLPCLHASELREIYLEWNSLTGGLPDMFKDHVHLKEVSLYNNQLSGPLPDFSGDANLGILWLEQNKFTGARHAVQFIPSVLASYLGLQVHRVIPWQALYLLHSALLRIWGS
eukprot:4682961-Amphidinium_carterae.2